MRYLGACILIWTLTATAIVAAQENRYSISFFGSFTTSSKLFHHPNDVDEIIRNEYLPLNNIFGDGIDFRRNIESIRLHVGISVEYLRKTTPIQSDTNVPIEDGYTAIPIELSAYFMIPIGTDDLHIYMGGGGGIYLGSRFYKIGNEKAITNERKLGTGIHILSGVEYMISNCISIRSELKFRNVHFETGNRFTKDETAFNGSVVPLEQEPQTSRLDIDGMVLNLCIALHF